MQGLAPRERAAREPAGSFSAPKDVIPLARFRTEGNYTATRRIFGNYLLSAIRPRWACSPRRRLRWEAETRDVPGVGRLRYFLYAAIDFCGEDRRIGRAGS